MSMGTLVQFASSIQSGATQITNAASGMLAVIKAFLVTGIASKSVDSVTRSGSVVTVTISAGHPYLDDQVILMAGCTPSDYNGEVKVYNCTGTTFQYTVAGTPTTPATGTITAKIAPLGWENPFSATDTEVFRPADVTSSRKYYRFYEPSTLTVTRKNDGTTVSYTSIAAMLVEVYESMTDANTGVRLCYAWIPRYKTSNLGVRWILVGDSKTVYFFKQVKSEAASKWLFAPYGWGDYDNSNVSAAQRSFLYAKYGWNASTDEVESLYSGHTIHSATSSGGLYPAIQFATGIGGSLQSRLGTMTGMTGGNIGASSYSRPNAFDFSIPFVSIFLNQVQGTFTLRGRMRGYLNSLMLIEDQYNYTERMTGVVMADGTTRNVLMIGGTLDSGATNLDCTYSVDLTGPWG